MHLISSVITTSICIAMTGNIKDHFTCVVCYLDFVLLSLQLFVALCCCSSSSTQLLVPVCA